MNIIYVKDWEQFRKIIDNKGDKIIFYNINKYERQVKLEYFYNDVLYVYESPLDTFLYPCGIVEELPPDLTKSTHEITIENEIFGRRIVYRIGIQKIRGYNMFCIFSDFPKIVKEEMNKVLQDFILIEGEIEER